MIHDKTIYIKLNIIVTKIRQNRSYLSDQRIINRQINLYHKRNHES